MADHVAILRKSKIKKGDNLLGNILDGHKTIESRWYVNKIAPWNKVFKNDTIYFKESGRAIAAKATVSQVMQFENLNTKLINKIVKQYVKQIAPFTTLEEFSQWSYEEKNKRYCILVFLKNVKKIKPFNIDKTGFGNANAWLCVKNIDNIKIAE